MFKIGLKADFKFPKRVKKEEVIKNLVDFQYQNYGNLNSQILDSKPGRKYYIYSIWIDFDNALNDTVIEISDKNSDTFFRKQACGSTNPINIISEVPIIFNELIELGTTAMLPDCTIKIVGKVEI